MYMPIRKKTTEHHAALNRPGRIRKPRCRAGWCGPPWAAVLRSVLRRSSSCSRLLTRHEGHEGVELRRGERLAERLRHHARLEAARDLCVGVDDRLADELVERLPGLLGRRGQVVEVGPDRSGRPGRLECVASAAAGVGEDRLPVGCATRAGRRPPAACAPRRSSRPATAPARAPAWSRGPARTARCRRACSCPRASG